MLVGKIGKKENQSYQTFWKSSKENKMGIAEEEEIGLFRYEITPTSVVISRRGVRVIIMNSSGPNLDLLQAHNIELAKRIVPILNKNIEDSAFLLECLRSNYCILL
jgi:hypothetical protein